MTGRIHPHGGPNRLTVPQQETADELVTQGVIEQSDPTTGTGIRKAEQ